MQDFAQRITALSVPKDSVGVGFLGQAGFVFKTPGGQLMAVDPYLSDCCNRYFGFKRLMPYVLDIRDLIFDQLLITHAHYDHFDPDSVPGLMDNGRTELIGAQDTRAECERLGLHERLTFLGVGDSVLRGEMKLLAVPCDHGAQTPHALGLLLELAGKRIYIAGDTAFRPDYFENPELHHADLCILPINGAFGNLNETQAAQAVQLLSPRLSIPSHYWNFAEHFGNPALFQEKMREYAPKQKYMLMRPGEVFTL